MVEVPAWVLLVAVTVVVPDTIPCIRPLALTVNSETLPEAQTVVVPQQLLSQATVLPSLMPAVAVIGRYPSYATLPGFGVTVILETVLLLVTVMLETLLT
jgi:hypothetical protein